ncbi:MAG: hypothetical protein ACC682_06980 [Gemmatimonadota bacterium]
MTRYYRLAGLTLATLACGGSAESAESTQTPAATPAAMSASQEGWTGTFGGRAAGTYSGPIAIATIFEDEVSHVQLYSDAGDAVYLVMTIAPFMEGVGSGASAGVSFEVIFADSPDVYAALQGGTASQLKSGEPGDDRYPGLPTLEVTGMTTDEVTGRVNGTLWQALPDRDPSVTAAVDLQFTARACRAGPDFTACTNPRASWPSGGSP